MLSDVSRLLASPAPSQGYIREKRQSREFTTVLYSGSQEKTIKRCQYQDDADVGII